MLEKEIQIDEVIYYRGKTIQEEDSTYVEYRNDEIKSIRFFEVIDGNLHEIIDEDKLKRAIEKNYNIDNGYVE